MRRLSRQAALGSPCSRCVVKLLMLFRHAVGHIAKHEGWQGFYRGLGPSLIMVCQD